jgi:UPF0716 protein FxsA
MRFLLLFFIVMPILEMWLLITIGGHIGALSTILLVLLTALIGVGLLREQGFATLWRGREKLQQGQLPAQEMVEGLVLAISGALLLTPGFITDVVGFAGLLPYTRVLMVKLFLSRVTLVDPSIGPFGYHIRSEANAGGDTIDGESWDSESNLKKTK